MHREPGGVASLDGGECWVSAADRFTSGDIALGVHRKRRIGRLLSRSWRLGEEIDLSPLPGIELRFHSFTVSRLSTAKCIQTVFISVFKVCCTTIYTYVHWFPNLTCELVRYLFIYFLGVGTFVFGISICQGLIVHASVRDRWILKTDKTGADRWKHVLGARMSQCCSLH